MVQTVIVRASVLSLAGALALGCGPGGSTEHAPAAQPSCADRAAALRKSLEAERDAPSVVSRESLPRLAGGQPFGKDTEPGLALALRRDDIAKDVIVVIGGRVVAPAHDSAKLNRYFEAMLKALEREKSGPPLIYVSAAPELPARTLQQAIAQLPEHIPLRLVVSDASHPRTSNPLAGVTVPPGAAAWTRPWLEELARIYGDPTAAHAHLSKGLMRTGMASCPKFDEAMAAVGKAPPRDGGTVLAERIPAALEACGCAGVDPAFDMIFVLSYRPFGTPVRWLELPRNTPLSEKATVDDLARALARP